jgi:multiple sugar transport system permease protein
MKDRTLAILFLLPGVLISAIFILLPFLFALKVSFYKMDSFISPATFCGLNNYLELIEDPRFWLAFWNGIIYAFFSVFFQVLLGIAFALLLNEKFIGRGFLRGASITPYILPTVVVALVWQWMLNEQIGIVNALLKYVGISGISWFDNPGMAMVSVTFISIWAWAPFVTVCFLAALQGVPIELYDAAKVDGSSSWRRFIDITLPAIKPVLVVVAMLRGIWMFNKFDIIWILTKGGPVQATEHLPILAYQKAFGLYDVGGGTAVATLSFLFLSVIIFIYFRIFSIDEA